MNALREIPRRILGQILIMGVCLGAAEAESFACRDVSGRTVSRVIGGHQISHQEAPYQVALIVRSADGDGSFGCGGSLISRGFVLTAAHCVVGKEINGPNGKAQPGQVTVLYGGDSQLEMMQANQTAEVDSIIVHSRYRDRVPSPADIAVLRLKDPLDVPQTAVITLASPQMETALMADFTCARVTGYGRTESGRGSDQMLGVNLLVQPAQVCRNFSTQVTSEMLCAGYNAGDQTACNGDSGGPLVIREGPTGWVQVGIVSWGKKGCRGAGSFGVYTRVSSFVPWILQVTQ
ncbi:MAG: serine protease [Pseudomonadota bacterium]